ncbi:NAD(P)-binding domain-containing protein [Marinirhabdus gelatinilytica]|uniref:Nucleoside-diphosphate-sugar epimerase n=1 Tax=Marinirhabdus gelatinilytica TaxID=1703343 RepID=A0A370QK22_9FLAO|nr:NAD(P)-binding domain-containing protein [Marinirhabdus gelatinilytica]RDK88676.1 nucleoside-diphosphate-sugar epimerase [Marinirhabdus gelatinilytica]
MIIGIAGLGWLGKPLAAKLKTLGHTVKGTATSLQKATSLQQKGYNAFPLEITETGVNGEPQAFLENLEVLIIMIPPGLRRNTGADYVLKMTRFLAEIEMAKVPKCIFISSTSVYGDEQGTVTETDVPKPENEAGRQLKQVEQLFFTASPATSIVRFGGLIGGSRQPARYLAGRTDLSGGNAPVNLIHRTDCIAILVEILKQQAFGHIFNAVHPNHPLKKDYYTKKAKELGLDPPQYAKNEDRGFKQVGSVTLEKILNYTFLEDI